MKATLRSAVLLVGLLAWSIPSFAEVQNVKVGGDFTVRAFHRENLDLLADSTLGGDFIMSTVGLNIGADLTENVSAFIRLANERDWNGDSSATANAGDFDLSQAYITLKELFYSPLTVKIGQQPIVWGRGLVLGSNLLPSILLDNAATNDDRNAAISANEYTDFTAFDAIRATLDLSNVGGLNLPVTADYVYIRLDENLIGEDDDQTVQGVNFSTAFDQWNSEVEAYYLNNRDKSPAVPAGAAKDKDGSVSTIGVRGSAQPAEGSSLWGELAFQFGKRVTDLEGILASGSGQSGWLANLGAEHTFKDVATTPKVGGEWRYYSGQETDGSAAPGWAAIAPGYFTTAIREFQSRAGVTGFYPVAQGGVTSGQTNQNEFALFGGFKPLEDLSVNSRLSWFVLPVAAKVVGANAKRHKFVGTEWDTQLKYDYTSDVQFGLLYALFLPGNVFRDAPGGGDNTAQQLVTTVSVKF